MLIAGVLCAVVAAGSAAFGLRALARRRTGDPARRMLAPAQLAAAAMLAAGALVALSGPPRGALPVLIVAVVGAIGTLAAGSWQVARYLLRRPAGEPPPAGGCASCDCGCGQSGPATGSGPTQLRLMSIGWVANIDSGNG